MSKPGVRLRQLEKTLSLAGLTLMAVFVVARISGEISASLALQEFEEAGSRLEAPTDVDLSLWSAQRILEYRKSLVGQREHPVAVLRIPKLQLVVPVFDGTDELTLNRGAGRIIGTARAGETGNTGIAGHRDGFFRGLKDISQGDELLLKTPGRMDHYVVTATQITTPDDVSVLRPTSTATLTLVTCYPFYFAGSAPQRYIVHASIRPVDASDGVPLSSARTP
jgi:sortase A